MYVNNRFGQIISQLFQINISDSYGGDRGGGVKQKKERKNRERTSDTDNSMVIVRGRESMEEEEGIGEINGNATNTIKFFLNEKNKTINLLLGFSLGKRTFIFKSLINVILRGATYGFKFILR